jgi:hypothetical protein
VTLNKVSSLKERNARFICPSQASQSYQFADLTWFTICFTEFVQHKRKCSSTVALRTDDKHTHPCVVQLLELLQVQHQFHSVLHQHVGSACYLAIWNRTFYPLHAIVHICPTLNRQNRKRSGFFLVEILLNVRIPKPFVLSRKPHSDRSSLIEINQCVSD